MINKNDVISFFNEHAGSWDAEMIRNDEIINIIFDNAGVSEGKDILDVACGTGVLFPDYLKRNAGSVTGIDISEEMIKIAASKISDDRIRVICGDVEETEFAHSFDIIMVYNAFPHFPNPERLVQHLSTLLKKGGRLSIAHGMSRERIDGHHSGRAKAVSNGLMFAEELALILAPYFDVDIIVSDDRMYQVCGIKK